MIDTNKIRIEALIVLHVEWNWLCFILMDKQLMAAWLVYAYAWEYSRILNWQQTITDVNTGIYIFVFICNYFCLFICLVPLYIKILHCLGTIDLNMRSPCPLAASRVESVGHMGSDMVYGYRMSVATGFPDIWHGLQHIRAHIGKRSFARKGGSWGGGCPSMRNHSPRLAPHTYQLTHTLTLQASVGLFLLSS